MPPAETRKALLNHRLQHAPLLEWHSHTYEAVSDLILDGYVDYSLVRRDECVVDPGQCFPR